MDKSPLHEDLPLVVSTFFLVLALTRQLQASLAWGHESWNMTEWLINYSGGFVRRGLSGEVVSLISAFTHVPANLVVVTLSVAIYVLMFYLLVRKVGGAIPLAVMLSPIAMGAPAYEEFVVRKDVLGILLLFVSLQLRARPGNRLGKHILVNVVTCSAILMHESFGFFGLPALIAFNACAGRDDRGPAFSRLGWSGLALAPAILAFAAVLFFHGDHQTAVAINSHWRDLWVTVDPEGCHLDTPCVDTPWAAIDALQWSLSRTVSLNASLLGAFSAGIYVPLAWLLTAIACYYFLLQFLRIGTNEGEHSSTALDQERVRLSSILLSQLVLMAPLFVVGWDFGRWIFLWTASSITLFAFGYDPSRMLPGLFNRVSSSVVRRLPLAARPNPWYLLLIGIPGCCWGIESFFASSPIGYFANVIFEASQVMVAGS